HEKLLPRFWHTTEKQLDEARAFRIHSPAVDHRYGETSLLFILGASRSGKSTLESMLAASSDVKRAFETLRLSRNAEMGESPPSASEKLGFELPFGTETLTDFYRELAIRSQGARYVTTTLPSLLTTAGD